MDHSIAQRAVDSAAQDQLRGLARGGAVPDDPLAKWRQHFADGNLESTETQTLGVEGERLQKTIAKAFPDSLQNTWTYDDLRTAVGQSQNEWETKERIGKGKPQKLFHTCLGALDAHSNLFRFVPSGDKYFTLLTGAVTTLVKASSSHLKTIEALSNAIDTINDAAAHCSIESELIHSQAMQNAIAKFYIAVFLFFGDAILWYKSSSKKKIMNSLHNDFSEKFRLSLEIIQHLSANVRRVADLGTAAEVRVVRLELEELQCELQDVRVGLTGQLRILAELSRQQHRENIGYHQHTQSLLADYIKTPQILTSQDTLLVTDAPLSQHTMIEGEQHRSTSSGREFPGRGYHSPKLINDFNTETEQPRHDGPPTSNGSSSRGLEQSTRDDTASIDNAMLKAFGPLTSLQHNSHPIELAQTANQWIRCKDSAMLYLACRDQRSELAFAKASWHIKSLLNKANQSVILCHPRVLREHRQEDLIENLVSDMMSRILRHLPEAPVHSSTALQAYGTTTPRNEPGLANKRSWSDMTTSLAELLQLVPHDLHILLHCSDKIATLESARLAEVLSTCHGAVRASTTKVLKVLVFSPKLVALAPPLRQDQIKFFPQLSPAQMRILDQIP